MINCKRWIIASVMLTGILVFVYVTDLRMIIKSRYERLTLEGVGVNPADPPASPAMDQVAPSPAAEAANSRSQVNQVDPHAAAGMNQVSPPSQSSGPPLDTLLPLSKQKDLAAGCSQVYLDVGSNKGVQVRKLFEPDLYTGAPVLALFEEYFGPASARGLPSSTSGLCAIGFEASPLQEERLNTLETAYTRHGWRAHFIRPYIVSTTSGDDVTLWLNKDAGGVGASAVVHDGHSVKRIVKTVDLAEFMQTVIVHRTKLAGVKAAVVMKMDIEGSEFEVLPHMLKQGLLCKDVIDIIFIEWHARAIGKAAYKIRTPQLLKEIESQTKCVPTRMMKLDDESYSWDMTRRNSKWHVIPMPGN